MKSSFRILLFLAAGLALPAAQAGDASGKVRSIEVSPSSPLVLFSLESSDADYHRCNDSERYAFQVQNPSGQATLQVLLFAREHGVTVYVESLNTCNQYDAENIKNLQLAPDED